MNKLHKYKPADFTKVRTYSVNDRKTKVTQEDFIKSTDTNPALLTFVESLPEILKAKDLRAAAAAVANANRLNKPVIIGIGGHVIKCGLTPFLINLMKRGVISAICMNGGASIHDFETATIGNTSEDVGAAIETGMFGMVKETGKAMNEAICIGAAKGWGMGYALGKFLLETGAPYMDKSLLATGADLGVPVMAHISIGADTIHMHSEADGGSLGATTFTDFKILVSILKEIGDGGVYLNIGSAALLPEVFLKAINVARNLSSSTVEGFTTVNMDMFQHYRPTVNVVQRPTQNGSGKGYALTGHHEIMVPLLFQTVLALLDSGEV